MGQIWLEDLCIHMLDIRQSHRRDIARRRGLEAGGGRGTAGCETGADDWGLEEGRNGYVDMLVIE